MVAAANRFLSKLFLLSKATLGAIFSTAEGLERPTWQWQVLRLPHGLRTSPFSKKTHGDGAGIVRKSMLIASAFRLVARRPGNQKRFWRDPVTRATGVSESCNEKTSTDERHNPAQG